MRLLEPIGPKELNKRITAVMEKYPVCKAIFTHLFEGGLTPDDAIDKWPSTTKDELLKKLDIHQLTKSAVFYSGYKTTVMVCSDEHFNLAFGDHTSMFHQVRNMTEWKDILKCTVPHNVYIEQDLNGRLTGYDVALQLIKEHHNNPHRFPDDFYYESHHKNIQGVLDYYFSDYYYKKQK